MLGVIALESEIRIELFGYIYVIFRFVRATCDGKIDDDRAGFFDNFRACYILGIRIGFRTDFGMSEPAHILYRFCQRISSVNPNAAYVVRRVRPMQSARPPARNLRNRTFGLYRSNE